jgi:Superinfection immunity protein
MTFLLLATLLYFLPTIIGHNRHNAGGIFLLNLLLGWTVIGWVVAMVWACSAETRLPVVVVAGPGRFCTQCGSLSGPGARYCSACGRMV